MRKKTFAEELVARNVLAPEQFYAASKTAEIALKVKDYAEQGRCPDLTSEEHAAAVKLMDRMTDSVMALRELLGIDKGLTRH